VLRRVEQILEEPRSLSPERVQHLRALEVLERIGTNESRQTVQKLASGAPGAWLTQEAQAMLRRLASKQQEPQSPPKK
jgi:hypothetical protein